MNLPIWLSPPCPSLRNSSDLSEAATLKLASSASRTGSARRSTASAEQAPAERWSFQPCPGIEPCSLWTSSQVSDESRVGSRHQPPPPAARSQASTRMGRSDRSGSSPAGGAMVPPPASSPDLPPPSRRRERLAVTLAPRSRLPDRAGLGARRLTRDV